MNPEKKMLCEKDFLSIFSDSTINNLLSTEFESYPLAYYFMREFISFKYYDQHFYLFFTKQTGFTNIFKSLVKYVRLSYFIGKCIFKKTIPPNNQLDILFISRNRFVNLKSTFGKEFKSDYLFGNLIQYIKNKYPSYKLSFLSMDIEPLPSIDDLRLQSLIEYSNPIIMFKSALLSIKVHLTWSLNKRKITNCLERNNCKYLSSLFKYSLNFKSLFFYILSDYSLKNIILKTNPKLIIGNDDVICIKPRINSEKINLILMQSASIDPNNEKYRDLFQTMFPSLFKLIPDYFLASGTQFRDIKQETNAAKCVIVTGQPRHDIFYYVRKVYSKNKFLEAHKIDPTHKLILWTTQCSFMSHDENIRNLDSISESIEGLADITLLIKQHPYEDVMYTNMIEAFFEKCNINFLVVPKDSDIYELLYICDIMITKNSTTAREAIALNKSIIILNLSEEGDYGEYVTEGVAIGVYDKESLKPTIKKLLLDDFNLVENKNKYIEKYLYKIDGKSTERVAELISNFLKGKISD